MASVQALQNAIERERKARVEAEYLLEIKSKELFSSNKELTGIKNNLEDLVKKRTEELLQKNYELLAEIKHHKETQKALENACEEATSANKLKAQFLANMSHEIRTPLNAIIGLGQILLYENLEDHVRDFVGKIKMSGEHLLTMINDILDFSKIEANRLMVEDHPFQLGHIIEECMDIVVSLANEKGLELAYFIESHAPSDVVGDSTRLKQILVNLLSNAVKFTEKGEITVHVSLKESKGNVKVIEFKITDTGIGIPESRIKNLFQAFTQVDASTTRKYGGTGLGLSICKHLTELMGGDIFCASTEGVGTSFIVTIPFKTEVSSVQPCLDKVPEFCGKKAVIVDDNKTNLKIIEHYLKRWGIEIPITFTHPSAALSWFTDQHDCDFAVLDMQMPEMDGLQLAKALRAIPKYLNMPLMMLTSTGLQRIDDHEGIFNVMLAKPVRPDKFLHFVKELFNDNLSIKRVQNKSVSLMSSPKKNIRILVAEDNELNQKVIEHMLRILGYQIEMVSNGKEAIEKMKENQFDVVLTDIQMPVMDGVELTKWIKSTIDKSSQPRIIALTAHALEHEKERYFSAGIDDYVTKPVLIETLKKALDASFGGDKVKKEAKETTVEEIHQFLNDFYKRWGDDSDDLLLELLPLYLETSDHEITRITEALDGDKEAISMALHTLKGVNANLGFDDLVNLIVDLEGRSDIFSNEAMQQLDAFVIQQKKFRQLVAEDFLRRKNQAA